ncbi:MAG: hypothetical protein QME13_01690 [Thermoanaerobacteraceae bacterium]|nr:hypothetical protein [Thermoanaerobacteraceae bacterium]
MLRITFFDCAGTTLPLQKSRKRYLPACEITLFQCNHPSGAEPATKAAAGRRRISGTRHKGLCAPGLCVRPARAADPIPAKEAKTLWNAWP